MAITSPLDCPTTTYLPASWKGVPFQVESTSDAFGRRGELYEYPLSETIGFKDLGRKARRFKVEGYLIGSDQVAQTVTMARAAESKEPGALVHPMFGNQQVTCVQLTVSAEYLREKRRTKLSFDFIEAVSTALSYSTATTIPAVFSAGTQAIASSMIGATWVPSSNNRAAATQVSLDLAQQIAPASSEESWDAISLLERGVETASAAPVLVSATRGSPRALAVGGVAPIIAGGVYMTFTDVISPITNGTAMIRLIHPDDAMARLCTFNAAVVDVGTSNPNKTSVESMVVSARLSLVRDYALVAAQTTYSTVVDALKDLDFIMAIYDEEEQAAASRGDDVTVSAIRVARAAAAQSILVANIRLPGLVDFDTQGVWPSLVCAQKFYADGTRYADVERYSPQSPPFFIGRDAVGPAY